MKQRRVRVERPSLVDADARAMTRANVLAHTKARAPRRRMARRARARLGRLLEVGLRRRRRTPLEGARIEAPRSRPRRWPRRPRWRVFGAADRMRRARSCRRRRARPSVRRRAVAGGGAVPERSRSSPRARCRSSSARSVGSMRRRSRRRCPRSSFTCSSRPSPQAHPCVHLGPSFR